MAVIPTVYVETNFLLELVFEQEEHEACRDLLELARSQRCALCLPVHALSEAWETIGRRRAEMQSFPRQLREVARMRRMGISNEERLGLDRRLFDELNAWSGRWTGHVRELGRIARLLPHTLDTLLEADALVQARAMGRQPDALMLAAVLQDLTARTPTAPMFLNRNTRDFGSAATERLKEHGCALLGHFRHGVERVRSLAK